MNSVHREVRIGPVRARQPDNVRASETPTSLQFDALQRMYEYFNTELFDGGLVPCMLNFSRKARTYGFFAPDRWERNGDTNRVSEISLNPATLKARTTIDIASTLVHEMAHAWQHQFGKPSRRNYHNAEWATMMESIGLMPSDTGEPGGRRTGQRMTHYVIPGGRYDQAFGRMPAEWFLPFLCSESSKLAGKVPDPSKTKYACPTCHANVWGRPGIRLLCSSCAERYQDEGLNEAAYYFDVLLVEAA